MQSQSSALAPDPSVSKTGALTHGLDSGGAGLLEGCLRQQSTHLANGFRV